MGELLLQLKPEVTSDSADYKDLLAVLEGFGDAIWQSQWGINGLPHELWLQTDRHDLQLQILQRSAAVLRLDKLQQRQRWLGRHHADQPAYRFTYQGITFSQEDFHVFPGLCAVDHRQHLEQTFQAFKAMQITTARAGAYKPRSSPYDFQGHGAKCLVDVFELAGKYGIKILAMEAMSFQHVEEIKHALKETQAPVGVILQVGTRNAQNFSFLQQLGQQNLPVLYKRGMAMHLNDALSGCEYIANEGNRRVIFALRGLQSHMAFPHRNVVDVGHIPAVKRLSRMPVCFDPSHSTGGRLASSDGILDIFHITAQAVIAGCNMLLVDVHPDPKQALCDGFQALTLHELPGYLEDIQRVRICYLQRQKSHDAALALSSSHRPHHHVH